MCKYRVNAMSGGRRTVPLRTIIQKCLTHIDNLEASRLACDHYEKEFQELKLFSESLKTQADYACTEGEKEFNRKKNRYKDILPFNASRVILSEFDGLESSNYINANYIKGASGSPAYIASQGPLPNTVNDFWRMIVECEVQVIVMACNAEEAGKHKCENYWVEREGERRFFGNVEILLLKANSICPDFLVRTMRLQYTNDRGDRENRTICQFHYSAWPDHGVPPLVRPLLDMVRLMRDTQASETLPVLVHCSAGCGRTGTVCAIDFVWGLLRLGKLSEDFSLYNLVRDMRKQRVAMVQTKEQYMLVHQAVRELFKEHLKIIESHHYENVTNKGEPLIEEQKEPIYETLSLINCDEKKDGTKSERLKMSTMEFGDKSAPPLPKKMFSSVACSKLEKEVENLTEKNRIASSLRESYFEESGNNLNRKPKITKLKALFERGATKSTISRSHSIGPIRRPVLTEALAPIKSEPPIQNAGKLKVPKLTAITRPVPNVKRSKSLKVTKEPVQLLSLLQSVTSDEYLNDEKDDQIKKNVANHSPERDVKKKDAKSEEKFDARRRRSLESLIGEYPTEITWPKSAEKNQSVSFERPRIKSHLSFRHQLQLLSSASQRTMNSLASGLGIRERRNSFRQAVSKDDAIDRVSLQFGSEGRFVSVPEGNSSVFVDSANLQKSKMLTVRAQNGEILLPSCDQPHLEQSINLNTSSKPTHRNDQVSFNRPQVRRTTLAEGKDVIISSQSMRLPSKNRFLSKLNVELQNKSSSPKLNGSFDLSEPRKTQTAFTDSVDGKSKTLPSSSRKSLMVDKNFKLISKSPSIAAPEKSEGQVKRAPGIGADYIALKDTTSYPTFKNQYKPPGQEYRAKPNPSDDLYTVYNPGMNNGPQFIRIGKTSSASSQSSDNLSDYQKKSLPERISPKKNSKNHSDSYRLSSDRLKVDLSSESSSSSGARELNTVLHAYKSYKSPDSEHGKTPWNVVTRRKSTSATIEILASVEPTAPPRTRKRSDGVRHSSPEFLMNTSLTANSFTENKEWNGAQGVDLDTVAASLQRSPELYSGARVTSDSEKEYYASVPSYIRKQQYL